MARRLWPALVGAVVFTLVYGCGGGGGPQGSNDANPLPTPGGGEFGTARVHVDVASGQVTVTPLHSSSRAVFAGTSIGLTTSTLFDQPGNTGLRVIRVAIRNQSGLPVGQLVDGTVTGLRAFLGNFTNLGSPDLDMRDQVTVSTVAGTGVAGWLDGSALTAQLNMPWGLALGPDGTLYFADQNNHRIRLLRGGSVSTLAGAGSAGNVDGVGTLAQFNNPLGVAYNPTDGSVVVADKSNNCVRRVAANGRVSRIAGTGVSGYLDGPGDLARLSWPFGVSVSSNGVIYVADSTTFRVRTVALTGPDPTSAASYTVGTLAGSGAIATADGIGISASFNRPYAITQDPSGNLYVAEGPGRVVRLVTPDGVVTTVAGTGSTGTADGIGNVATFSTPSGLAWSSDGLLVCDYGALKLRLVTRRSGFAPNTSAGWVVRTLAGSGAAGAADGPGTTAQFSGLASAAVDGAGNIYLADPSNSKLRLVTPTNGHLSFAEPNGSAPSDPVTLANADGIAPGTGMGANTPYLSYPQMVDRGATSATKDWAFAVPSGVKAFEFTVLVEADTNVPAAPAAATTSLGSHDTYVWTLAGSNSGGFVDGVGTAARFNGANGLALGPDGPIYVADTGNNAIRRIARDGKVVTIAGLIGSPGSVDGSADVARFKGPTGIATTGDANVLYVADYLNHTIRRMVYTPPAGPVAPSGWTVSTIAGQAGVPGYVDGAGDAAKFSGPYGIVADQVGTLYVTEAAGNRVRRLQLVGSNPALAASWWVTFVAGSSAGTAAFIDSSNGASARFSSPEGIAVSPLGELFVADDTNDFIRKIVLPGAVSTFGSSDLAVEEGVAVDSAGYVYACDGKGITRYTPSGGPELLVAGKAGVPGFVDGPGDVARFSGPIGLAIDPSGTLYALDQSGFCVRVIERAVSAGTP
ncbi:MAG: hypothetical protein HYU66_23320 [Armatimonadetes bacterium]|nr:hypothetical protein [Armatimonadota bacterium]